MSDAAKRAQHDAAFGEPLRFAKARADWWLEKLTTYGDRSKGSGLLTALAFDKAAEEHQLAASREAASRRYLGLDPE